MSTVTTKPTTSRPVTPGRVPQLTRRGAIHSESTKLLTLRTPWVLAVAMAVLSAGAGAILALSASPDPSAVATTTQAVSAVTQSGRLFVAIIAALSVTNEFASGQIRTTFVAVPRRLTVLAAKCVVIAAVAVVVTIVSAAAAWAAATVVLIADSDATSASFDPAMLRTAASTAVWLVVVAVFSVMVATIVRHAAAGIVIALGTLYILPIGIQLLSLAVKVDVTRFVFTSIPNTLDQMFSGTEPSGDLGVDLAVLVLWLIVPTAFAIQLITRRDV